MSASTTNLGEAPSAGAPSATAPEHPVRASDADREQVCHVLHQATGAGMLTLAEAEERLAAAYAARFRHDLEPLTADLPRADTHRAGTSGRLQAWLLSLFAMVLAARSVVGPVIARHKVLAGLAASGALIVAGLLVYWGLSTGEEAEG